MHSLEIIKKRNAEKPATRPNVPERIMAKVKEIDDYIAFCRSIGAPMSERDRD